MSACPICGEPVENEDEEFYIVDGDKISFCSEECKTYYAKGGS